MDVGNMGNTKDKVLHTPCDTYNGDWEEEKYGGQGVMTYANGDTFVVGGLKICEMERYYEY